MPLNNQGPCQTWWSNHFGCHWLAACLHSLPIHCHVSSLIEEYARPTDSFCANIDTMIELLVSIKPWVYRKWAMGCIQHLLRGLELDSDFENSFCYVDLLLTLWHLGSIGLVWKVCSVWWLVCVSIYIFPPLILLLYFCLSNFRYLLSPTPVVSYF